MKRLQPFSPGLLRALRAVALREPAIGPSLGAQRTFSCAQYTRTQRTTVLTASGCSRHGARHLIAARRSESAPLGSRRFTSSPRICYKTVEEAKARHYSGPFSWKAALVLIVVGIGLTVYFREEKARLERMRIADQTKGVGKPKVGGPFDLIDQNGNKFTHEDMRGKYALIYFGFTHCPDICPDELDKMAEMYDLVLEEAGVNVLRPVFISCDPWRDTPAVVKEYLKEFHRDFIGLTGEYDEVKNTCKVYRVYFSTPPHLKPGQDYLVDHSIYFYLMDPDGDFVEALGRQHTAEDAARIISDHVKDWKGKLDTSEPVKA